VQALSGHGTRAVASAASLDMVTAAIGFGLFELALKSLPLQWD
jgi:hypothetical protein